MYDLSAYAGMIADSVRVRAYEAAIRAAVRPGDILVEIGAGLGIFSMLACRQGARQVYAIETESIIDVARELAKANGLAGRIEFIQDRSENVMLPEKADVIIADLRGILPYFYRNIPTMADARDRLLTRGGTLIPARDTVWAAVVEAPEEYALRTSPWDALEYEFDLSPVQRRLTNSLFKPKIMPAQFLAEPARLSDLDYRTVHGSSLSAHAEWSIARSGIAHGLCLWFDTELTAGIGFSNAPGGSELVYGNLVLPLTEPIPVRAGDTVAASIQANLIGKEYVWRWQTEVRAEGDRNRVRAGFRQSTFCGQLLPRNDIKPGAENYRPRLNRDGEVDAFALKLMDEPNALSIRQIAVRLYERFADQFADERAALARACELSRKYAR